MPAPLEHTAPMSAHELPTLGDLAALLCTAMATLTGTPGGRLVYVTRDQHGQPVPADVIAVLRRVEAAATPPPAWADTQPADA